MHLIGRESERRRIEAAFAAGERAIVLVGPAGVGKTTLARAASPEVLFVDADSGAGTKDDLLAAIARAVSVVPGSPDARVFLERLTTALDDRHAIVLVDGAERSLDVVRETALDLLDLTQHARVLITSRERIDLPDELVISVRPLARAAATELLVEEVRSRAPLLDIDDHASHALCEQAGDRPLAIQLVAARVATVGVERALALFGAAPAGDALDHVLDASWSLLSLEDRTTLSALMVFPTDFDRDAASFVLERDARADLERLTSSSMLLPAGDDRLTVSASVRARCVTDIDERIRERHAEHFAAIAGARADDRATWARLARERENLLAAFRASKTNPVRAARLAAILDVILVTAGPAHLHEEILTTALDALERSNANAPSETADIAIALGRHHGLRGRHAKAARLFERARTSSEAAGDDARCGWAEAFLAFSLRPLARFDDAERHARSTLVRAQRLGDVKLEVMGEQTLGLVAFDREDFVLAERFFRRALGVASNADIPRLEGIVHANLAGTALFAHDLDAAAEHTRIAQAIFTRIDDQIHLGRMANIEALVAIEHGQVDVAERLLGQLLDLSLEHGDLEGEVNARSGLARVSAARGDVRLATLRLDEARAVAERTDDVVERGRLERLARKIGSPTSRVVVVAARDGRSISIDGRVIDLSKRGPSRRLVLALVEHRLGLRLRDRQGLDVEAMLEAGWPGERMRPESGAARVYMAVRRLREVGLEAILRTDEHGYSLDRDIDVSWRDPER